jgi:hypothetical protein
MSRDHAAARRQAKSMMCPGATSAADGRSGRFTAAILEGLTIELVEAPPGW